MLDKTEHHFLVIQTRGEVLLIQTLEHLLLQHLFSCLRRVCSLFLFLNTNSKQATQSGGFHPLHTKYGRQWQSPKSKADKAASLIHLAIKDILTYCWRFFNYRQDQTVVTADTAQFLWLPPLFLQLWLQEISAALQFSPKEIFAHSFSEVRDLLRKFTGPWWCSPSLWFSILLLHCIYLKITADNWFFYKSTIKPWK